MKRVASILTALVFLAAIGSALASTLRPSTQGYIRSANPFVPCEVDRFCNDIPSRLCKSSGGLQIYDGSTMSSTSCGVELFDRP